MIDGPNFSLNPGPRWLELPTDDPESRWLVDENRDISATVSCLALRADPGALEDFAHVFAEMRIRAETDAGRAFGHVATIYEPIVVPQPWGQALAHYGHDGTGRQFNFSGIVTPSGLIGLHMSSSRLSEAKLAEAMDDLLARIEFDRTPLSACALH